MLDGVAGVKAKAACAAGGWWQELAALIEPNGIDTEMSALCEFANLKGCLYAVLDARHGPKDTLWSAVQSQEDLPARASETSDTLRRNLLSRGALSHEGERLQALFMWRN